MTRGEWLDPRAAERRWAILGVVHGPGLQP